jgi:hypothetical protein|tara:strand:+ start:1048 stop:1335 length:288 start_codon:yes stop_codon:yes gene_type:complete
MHGGFENETPNIPTNSIMKLDLVAHVKGNAQLMQKLESAFQTHFRQGSASSTNSRTGGADGTTNNSAANSRATTPPMQSLAKANMKIRMGKGEIE